jgi:excisionase family DNA binding protein
MSIPAPASESSAKFLTTRQGLAERIGTSLRTVDEWKALGLIPYLKIGSLVRFDYDEVIAVLRERYTVQAKSRTAK